MRRGSKDTTVLPSLFALALLVTLGLCHDNSPPFLPSCHGVLLCFFVVIVTLLMLICNNPVINLLSLPVADHNACRIDHCM
jgi:hypothetical protein